MTGDKEDMRCTCTHRRVLHNHDGDCTFMLDKFGNYCRCKEFVPAPGISYKGPGKPVATLSGKKRSTRLERRRRS